MGDASVAPATAGRPGSVEDIRRRYAAAFRPRPWLYWCDLLASAALGWTLFAVSLTLPAFSLLHAVTVVTATLALLRAALFIHELAHLRAGSVPGFEIAWHALVGVPLCIPSLMYVGSHTDHHKRTAFGTVEDPEYAPIAHWNPLRIVWFVVVVAFVPVLLVIRWGVLGPLTRLFPHSRLRRKTIEEWSTLVINTDYRRPHPTGKQDRRWLAQELATAAFVWAAAAGAAVGWLPLRAVLTWLFVGAGILVVNQVRTLAAHGYENEGDPVDAEGQLLDSITLRGGAWLTGLVAPVGLRYHALHHHLPAVPYHDLGKLHRRLLAELPPEAPYCATQRDGVSGALRDLWRKSRHRDDLNAGDAPTGA